jgi:hypothetical protein
MMIAKNKPRLAFIITKDRSLDYIGILDAALEVDFPGSRVLPGNFAKFSCGLLFENNIFDIPITGARTEY